MRFSNETRERCRNLATPAPLDDVEEDMVPAVRLRAVATTDLPYFFEHSRDEEAVRMAMPAGEVADWAAFSEKWKRILSSRSSVCRTVICGSDIAGYIAQFEQMNAPSVSYWFGRGFWGRGLATGALQLFLAETETRPLHARVASVNRASLGVLERNGFKIVDVGSYYSAPHARKVREIVLRLD